MAYQSADLVKTVSMDLGASLEMLRVDGGASANNLLMQHQADVLGIPVVRGQVIETTALGAAFLAGLAVNFWESKDQIRDITLRRSIACAWILALTSFSKTPWGHSPCIWHLVPGRRTLPGPSISKSRSAISSSLEIADQKVLREEPLPRM